MIDMPIPPHDPALHALWGENQRPDPSTLLAVLARAYAENADAYRTSYVPFLEYAALPEFRCRGLAALVEIGPLLPPRARLHVERGPSIDAHLLAAYLAEAPAVETIVSLDLAGRCAGVETMCALAGCARLRNLEVLRLGENDLDATCATALAAARLPRLRELRLDNNQIGDAGVAALAASPILDALEILDLESNAIGETGVIALLRTPRLSRLVELLLGKNPLGDAGAAALAKTRYLTSIATLGLRVASIGAAGVQALRGSRVLAGTATLDLSSNPLGDGGALALAGIAIERLTSLDLSKTQLGVEGARALAGWAVIARVTDLDIGSNAIGDDGITALADALRRVRKLVLNGCAIGDDGVRAIAAARLEHLRTLDLTDNAIGDDGAATAATIANLDVLHLRTNQIGDRGAAAVLEGARTLRDLDLGNNQIRRLELSGAFARLARLDLAWNPLRDDEIAKLAAFSGFHSLVWLDLGGTEIGQRGLDALTTSTVLPRGLRIGLEETGTRLGEACVGPQ